MRVFAVCALLTLMVAMAVAAPITEPGRLGIFYGFPSAVNGSSGSVEAAAVFAVFDVVVFGDGIGNSGHADHANVQDIMSIIQPLGTKVFGYVNLAGPDTVGDLQTEIDGWVDNLGVDGIFLDEFGYDFGVSRTRQNAVVSHAHTRGVPVIANGYHPDQAMGSQVNATYNPTGTATELGSFAGDGYLLENLTVAFGDNINHSYWNWRAERAKVYQGSLGVEIYVNNSADASSQIVIDGDFSDWADVTPVTLADSSSDALGGSAAEFTNVYVTSDASYLFVRLQSTTVFNISGGLINLYLDLDNSASTGFHPTEPAGGPSSTFGSEMLITGGTAYDERVGGFNDGSTTNVFLSAAPSGSATDVEMRISLTGTYDSDSAAIFPATGSVINLLVQAIDGSFNSADIVPDAGNGGIAFATGAISQPTVEHGYCATLINEFDYYQHTFSQFSASGAGANEIEIHNYPVGIGASWSSALTESNGRTERLTDTGRIELVDVTGDLSSAEANFVASGALTPRVGYPITVDGLYGDWAPLSALIYDGTDAGATPDFAESWATNDASDLYLRIVSNSSFTADANHLEIYLDTDMDAFTGQDLFPIGADYLVQGSNLYVWNSGTTSYDFVQAVSVSSTPASEAEVAIPITAIGLTGSGDALHLRINNPDTISDIVPDFSGGAMYRYFFADSIIPVELAIFAAE